MDEAMTKYRMLIYRPGGELFQTCDVFAKDDVSAKESALEKFDELFIDLTSQKHPKLDDPRLEKFRLYDGNRLVYEMVEMGVK